jgi:hypothetical protein
MKLTNGAKRPVRIAGRHSIMIKLEAITPKNLIADKNKIVAALAGTYYIEVAGK